jgi:hypothetical protein
MRVVALVAATATLIAVPAAAAQASVKRTSPKAATVTYDYEKVKDTVQEFMVVNTGGDAFRSVYVTDDTGNEYWSRYGAMEGLDGRPVDAFYDFDNNTYYAKAKTALNVLPDTVEGLYIDMLIAPRLGNFVPLEEQAAIVAAFKATNKNYLAVDGKQYVTTQDGSLSPIMRDLDLAIERFSGLDGIKITDNCKTTLGEEVCTVTFTGNVQANGTNKVTFRSWYNAEGYLTSASIIDGKKRVIAKDVVNYAATDVITIPSADSAFYLDLL